MRIRVMFLILLILVVAGCGGGGGGGSTVTPPPAAVIDTVTAFAGGDKTQNGPANSITLTGTGTSSVGSALQYAWTVTSPNASNVTLGTPNAASTTFKANATGSYTVQLKVTSATNASASAVSTATITVIDYTAIEVVTANAGVDKTIDGPGAASAVTLNGSANYNIGPVTYAWSVVSSNAASAHFGSASTPVTTFYADAPGTYTVRLTATSSAEEGATAFADATITVMDDTVLGARNSYFPLVPGTVWVYQDSSGHNMTKQVLADGTYRMVTSTPGNGSSYSRYTISNQKVYITETTVDGTINGSPVTFTTTYNFNNQNSADPGQLVLPSDFGNNVVQSSSYLTATYTDINSATPTARTTTITSLGNETIAVGGVTYSAVKLKVERSNATTPAYSWYVQGIGLIKDDTYTLVSITRP